ncbi:hypothetical protein [Magnetococcus sp. PR-3]|uniref:hypothetical protein n=1 Tax=Magnetococcus sp. PR-3 TaxID=3120355 RepID=UPI002FCE4572
MSKKTPSSTKDEHVEAITWDKAEKVKMVPNPQPVEEVYMDGVAGIMARGGVIKINGYKVVGLDKDDNAEVRRVTHQIVLPAVALAELAHGVQMVLKGADNVRKMEDPAVTTVNDNKTK